MLDRLLTEKKIGVINCHTRLMSFAIPVRDHLYRNDITIEKYSITSPTDVTDFNETPVPGDEIAKDIKISSNFELIVFYCIILQ